MNQVENSEKINSHLKNLEKKHTKLRVANIVLSALFFILLVAMLCISIINFVNKHIRDKKFFPLIILSLCGSLVLVAIVIPMVEYKLNNVDNKLYEDRNLIEDFKLWFNTLDKLPGDFSSIIDQAKTESQEKMNGNELSYNEKCTELDNLIKSIDLVVDNIDYGGYPEVFSSILVEGPTLSAINRKLLEIGRAHV